MDYKEDIVISGIGCRFPDANSIEELSSKILLGETMVRKNEEINYADLSATFSGRSRDYLSFDNIFFGISKIVTRSMDINTRQIMQLTFEAIMDAGISPEDVRGTNAAVITGSSYSDVDLLKFADRLGGYSVMGRTKNMHANRTSFWMDLKGTSVALDSSWCSGIKVLQLGLEEIQRGSCDIAIVGTSNIARSPYIVSQWRDMGQLSPDGKSRAFDDAANGYARSDGAVMFVLQRASQAKRCYAIVKQAFVGSYHDMNGPFKPSQKYWEEMLAEFYRNYKGDRNGICYVEAHAAGTKEEDAVELNALANVLCKDRTEPLLVGSIKSNIGHTDQAAAACGIVKAIMGFETGLLHRNYDYTTPNSECQGILGGQLKVVDENLPWPEGKAVAVNAQAVNGSSYGHVVLLPNPKKKTLNYDDVPRLVLLSDRLSNFIPDLIDKVEAMPYDPEFIALLHEVHAKNIRKYLARGYVILPKPKTGSIRECTTFSEVKRPVWFIFSGMGSQWPSMGKRLMYLPIFRESIAKCHRTLQPLGLDLVHIITTSDTNIFDNILHSFVGIAAIQIALVDVLNALNIVPDGIIGHSVGELGCAYADGCLTAEQMILAAYHRGKVSIETELIKGFMAAVGKGYNEIKDELPEGIEVACHNSANSCTISGPAQLVQDYVEKLKKEGVFARTVNVANIAYHSSYIRSAAPKLLENLKKVMREPKQRSRKWVSTSNQEKNWGTDLARYCSAEYHTNNLLSPVYFEEGSKHIPKEAICIEIAPYGLLQAILKRSLDESCVNIPMTSRSSGDSIHFLLTAIGKMYIAGLQPQIANLYPKVEFPVSRGTPSLHQLVHWQQSIDTILETETYSDVKTVFSLREKLLELSSKGSGYLINNINVYPASLLLWFVWDIFSKFQLKDVQDCPVVFEDLRLHQVLISIELRNVEIIIQRGSGLFEVTSRQGEILVSGKVTGLADSNSALDQSLITSEYSTTLSSAEVYRRLAHQGIDVSASFRVLESVSKGSLCVMGRARRAANWSETLEGLMQLFLLEQPDSNDSISLPETIERVVIVPAVHAEYMQQRSIDQGIELRYDLSQNTATCGGVQVKGLKTSQVLKDTTRIVLSTTQFTPYNEEPSTVVKLDKVVYILEPSTDVELLRAVSCVPTDQIACVVFYKEPALGLERHVSTIQSHTAKALMWFLILDPSAAKFDPNSHFYKTQVAKGLNMNVLKNGVWGRIHTRNFPIQPADDTSFDNDVVALDYVAVSERTDVKLTEGCKVEYTGRLIEKGSKVMGLGSFDGRRILPDELLTWEVPPSLTAEEAVTLPLPYAQAYFSMLLKSGRSLYERVLVTDAYTSQGLAAVAVALPHCEKLIATVATQEERRLLLQMFPKIGEENVVIHKGRDFSVDVGLLTDGKMASVIYNSLDGEGMLNAFECVGPFAIVFHSGREDPKRNTKIGLKIFLNHTSFYSVSRDTITTLIPSNKKAIWDLLQKGLTSGEVRPLPHTVITKTELRHASDHQIRQKRHLITAAELKGDKRAVAADGRNSVMVFDDTNTWSELVGGVAKKHAQTVYVVSENQVDVTRDMTRRVVFLNASDDKRVQDVLSSEKLATVFVISLTNTEMSSTAKKAFLIYKGRLVVISRNSERTSELCARRREVGLPTTHFVVEVEEKYLPSYLGTMVALSEEESVIYLTSARDQSVSFSVGLALANILPRNLEEYCALGTSLSFAPNLVQLPTQTGVTQRDDYEVPPLIIIPGLQGDPVDALKPFARQLVYPAFVARHLNGQGQSLTNIALGLKQVIVEKCFLGKCVNLVGISWGTTLAIEVARLLEEDEYKVSLMLIDGPLKTLQDALLTAPSLQLELLQLVPGFSSIKESSGWDDEVTNLAGQLNRTQEKSQFMKSLNFLLDSLRSFVSYDFKRLPLNCPVTVVESNQQADVSKIKISDYLTSVKIPLPLDDALRCSELTHMLSAAPICDAMDNNTYRETWKSLDDFVIESAKDSGSAFFPDFTSIYDHAKKTEAAVPL